MPEKTKKILLGIYLVLFIVPLIVFSIVSSEAISKILLTFVVMSLAYCWGALAFRTKTFLKRKQIPENIVWLAKIGGSIFCFLAIFTYLKTLYENL